MVTDENFYWGIDRALEEIRKTPNLVHTEKWQSVDISKMPEMATHEVRHFFMRTKMPGEHLDEYRQQIAPNLPWADDHFEERVCGQPINPGIQWAKWPYGHSAERFLVDGKFNHNYMERYWPKQAGYVDHPSRTAESHEMMLRAGKLSPFRYKGSLEIEGIHHPYGDLADVVDQLVREPHTRQAILPVFFPEDTGAVHGGRVPCSLFYHFMMRDGKLDVTYMLRSCDILRHFRDDIYLTARLALWILDRCREKDKTWRLVKPGEYVMLISSLHCFRNDYQQLFGSK